MAYCEVLTFRIIFEKCDVKERYILKHNFKVPYSYSVVNGDSGTMDSGKNCLFFSHVCLLHVITYYRMIVIGLCFQQSHGVILCEGFVSAATKSSCLSLFICFTYTCNFIINLYYYSLNLIRDTECKIFLGSYWTC